jgi:hypothetical protein
VVWVWEREAAGRGEAEAGVEAEGFEDAAGVGEF